MLPITYQQEVRAFLSGPCAELFSQMILVILEVFHLYGVVYCSSSSFKRNWLWSIFRRIKVLMEYIFIYGPKYNTMLCKDFLETEKQRYLIHIWIKS